MVSYFRKRLRNGSWQVTMNIHSIDHDIGYHIAKTPLHCFLGCLAGESRVSSKIEGMWAISKNG